MDQGYTSLRAYIDALESKLTALQETVSCIAALYGYRPEELLEKLTELTRTRESMPDWAPDDKPKLEMGR